MYNQKRKKTGLFDKLSEKMYKNSKLWDVIEYKILWMIQL